MMGAKPNYFKIGLFVISAASIAVIAVVVLGAGALFRETIPVETYFEQSVQGLDVGSPVKFRGVQVGKIEEITLVSREYDTEQQYVLVRMSCFLDSLPMKRQEMDGRGLKGFGKRLKEETEKGLRIRLAAQGVTGTAYLEVDYLDPNRYPPLEIDFQPRYPYMVSAPSTILRLSESVERIMNGLERVDFHEIAVTLERALQGLKGTLEQTNIRAIGEQAEQLLVEVRQTNRLIGRLVEGGEVQSTLADASATMAAARRIVEASKRPVGQVIADLHQTSASIRGLAEKLESSSEGLPEIFSRLKRISRQVDDLIANQKPNIERTLENVRLTSQNLAELTETIKQDPPRILFGRPPPRSRRGE
jgi:phospholipid/cholesterol/gamma-HCH transport system substrate-binding protein/paraquat-inducible protein B